MPKKKIKWDDRRKARELMGKVDVPEGRSNKWEVQRFEFTPEEAKFAGMRMAWHGEGARWVDAGQYTRLMNNGYLVMSDTRAEMEDHVDAVAAAAGRCLVAGLGLGVVIQAILQKPEVTHVTVVEKSSDVIALVAQHYLARFGDRLSVVEEDIFEFRPAKGARYGMCWLDIWNDICADNLTEMRLLHRRYARRTDWYGSWSFRDIKEAGR